MKNRLFTLVLAVFSSAGTFAAAPTGTFVYEFNATNTPLWDLSGPLELNQEIIAAVGSGIPLTVPITVDHTIKGRLDGSGYSNVLVDTNLVSARYRAEGRVYTANGTTRAKLNVRATGRGDISGVTNNYKFVLVYKLDLDPLTQQLTGTVRGKAHFSKLIGGRVHQDTVVALPTNNNGGWALTLDLNSTQPPGGNAAITLPNGRFLQYSARGSYSESKDSTKLSLRGFGNSQGSKLTLRLSSTNAILTDLTGRVLGQKLNDNDENLSPTPDAPVGNGE